MTLHPEKALPAQTEKDIINLKIAKHNLNMGKEAQQHQPLAQIMDKRVSGVLTGGKPPITQSCVGPKRKI
jgi:hypothetical protein